MLLKEMILEEASKTASSRAADGIEVVVHRRLASVVRFAASVFHQGISESDCDVYIRVLLGNRVGVASTNRLEGDSLTACLKKALMIAEHVKAEPFRLTLPGPSAYPEVDSFSGDSALITCEDKTSSLSKGFERAGASGVLLSGSFTTRAGELAVVNSNGLAAYHPYTSAYLNSVATKDDASGFKGALSKDATKMDIEGTLLESAQNCLMASSPRALEPVRYRALLEPPAVSELLHWLSYIGFGAKNYHESTSFVAGRLGHRITGENVTIYDDGLDPGGMPAPFDMEGVPKRRLCLIEKGVARAVAYDTFTGAIEGRETTGHAPFPEDTEGPLPHHLFMEPGDKTREDLLQMLGRGVLVKSFHYVNGLLNPKETLMTGMTRHGTFYVEEGEIRYPVRPLRFTENIINAFGRVLAISRETGTFPNYSFPLSSVTAPYILIDGFSFTS